MCILKFTVQHKRSRIPFGDSTAVIPMGELFGRHFADFPSADEGDSFFSRPHGFLNSMQGDMDRVAHDMDNAFRMPRMPNIMSDMRRIGDLPRAGPHDQQFQEQTVSSYSSSIGNDGKQHVTFSSRFGPFSGKMAACDACLKKGPQTGGKGICLASAASDEKKDTHFAEYVTMDILASKDFRQRSPNSCFCMDNNRKGISCEAITYEEVSPKAITDEEEKGPKKLLRSEASKDAASKDAVSGGELQDQLHHAHEILKERTEQ